VLLTAEKPYGITAKNLAEAYRTKETKLSSNLSRNMGRFLGGKYYSQLEGAELQALKRVSTNSDYPSIRYCSVLTI
jgi:ORF6N domain.